jgi:hypothetical protein
VVVALRSPTVLVKLQMEQTAAIKFCVKLKKTATETFEMLKSACGEERVSSTIVFQW